MQQSNIAQTFAARDMSTPLQATLHDVELLADGKFARVLCTFNKDATQNDMRLAIAASFDNQAKALENTFYSTGEEVQNSVIFAGLVARNRPTQLLTPEVSKTMKEMSANVLMDTEDNSIWDVTSSGGQSFIVRQTEDDLATILSSAPVATHASMAARSTVTAAKQSQTIAKAPASDQPTMYAMFVNPTVASVDFGFIASQDGDTVTIASRSTDRMIPVSTDLLVNVAAIAGDYPMTQDIEAPDHSDAPELEALEYFKGLYSYDPEYYAKLEDIVRQEGDF